MSKDGWIKTENLQPREVDDCEYGFICWVGGEVELIESDGGISWDEAIGFKPIYDLKTPSTPDL